MPWRDAETSVTALTFPYNREQPRDSFLMLIQPLSFLNSVPPCLGMQGLRGLPAPKA